MSLLRQRAIDDRAESTFRARSPAEARAWFVRETSWRSAVELKLFVSQASVVRGSASTPIEVSPKATATSTDSRRGSRDRGAGGSGMERDWTVEPRNIDGLVS